MTTLTLMQAIDLAGGLVIPETCPQVIPKDQLAGIIASINLLEKCYEDILKRYDFKGRIAISLTHSPGFSCRVRRVESNTFAILIPLGMPARVRVMSGVLLRYWGRERKVLGLRSLTDNVPVRNEDIPQLLRPIFLNDPNAESYWEDIYQLDKTIEADPNSEPDVRELVHLSLVYLISHEITHILHGHFDLLERSKQENFELTQSHIRRGLELDADWGAAALSMQVLHTSIELAHKAGQPADYRLGWLRLSYVVTMLFGIFDAQRQYLHSYDEDTYNHPLVRCDVFAQAALASLNASDDIRNDLHQNLDEGWMRCIFAFNDLVLDVLTGMYGGFPEGSNPGPLQSLVYNRMDMLAVVDKLEVASKLLHEVRKLLPIYTSISE